MDPLCPEDVVKMLRLLNVSPPYFFVARSFGALYAIVAMSVVGCGNVAGAVYVVAATPPSVRILRVVVPRSSIPTWIACTLRN